MADAVAPHIDLMDGEFYAGDPFPAFAWMRRHAPAYYDEANDIWGVTRYEDVRAIGQDPQALLEHRGVAAQHAAAVHDRHGRPRAPAPAAHGERRVHPPGGAGPRAPHRAQVCDEILDRGVRERVRATSSPTSPPPSRWS